MFSSMLFQAIGNHEFDNGVEGLITPFLKEVTFPVLSCNIKPDRTLNATFGTLYLPYKIFEVGGEKVAVVGYTSRETPALSSPGKWNLIFFVFASEPQQSGNTVFCWRASRLLASLNVEEQSEGSVWSHRTAADTSTACSRCLFPHQTGC